MRAGQAVERSESTRTRAEVPGIGGLAAVGNLRRWRDDPCTFFVDLCERFGDVARFQLGPLRMVILRHPDHVAHVLQRHHRRYDKSSRGYNVMRRVFGTGLLTSEGELWKKQRRLVQPTFHRRYVEGFAAAIDSEAAAMIERWRGRPQLYAHDEMTETTMRIVVRTLFGMELDADIAELGRALDGMMVALRDHIVHLRLPWSVPTPRNLRQRADIRAVEAIVLRLIDQRRRDPSDDLLSMLIAARDPETGEAMTDAQLADEVRTLFLAGHDTTANTLAWALYLLSGHPSVRRRLEAEVDEVVGDGPVTAEAVSRMAYTRAVICEVLRLYPPAWIIPRRATEDDAIGGFAIRENDNVVAMPYVVHRHPRFWPNPEGFDPERFIDGPPAGDAKLSYVPFGAGPRLCVGKALAEMEAAIVIARIARRCHLDLISGQTVTPRSAITLKPSSRLAMRVRWR
jgi:cytochrome P450